MPSDLLIRNGTLLDPASGGTRTADILIRDGVIEEVGEHLSSEHPSSEDSSGDGANGGEHGEVDARSMETVDASGKLVSPGWMDMHVHLREPGYEHKETIKTGARAAVAGGFTSVACMPNTNPPIHTRDVVEFVLERAEKTPVHVYPIATVSKEREGVELAEMADLQDGGAVAFSDDGSPVQHSGLMRRALEYSSMLDAPIINHMEDLTLNPHGHMHEGTVSARLGVSGIPAMSEDVMIARDIEIAAATGGHVHVAHISTARAVELVREGKARGVRVTAEVCPHHFTLTDEAVDTSGFSTHTKMHPPLRGAADVEAIIEGLADGTIDAICTDHAPHAPHEKDVEFDAAPFGILGLETAWGLVGRELIEPGHLTVAEAVEKLTIAPRRILNLPVPVIEAGQAAQLTVFDADTDWTFEAGHIRSKSRNTPFVGSKMKGRAHGVYSKGEWIPVDEPVF